MSRRDVSIGFARRSGRVPEQAPYADPFSLVPPELRAAWWRAEMGITLTSGAVSAWVDAWAGNSLGNGTASRRPTTEAFGIGGRPTVLFDSAASQSLVVDLASPCLAGTRPYTWTVFQPTSVQAAVVSIAVLTDTGNGVNARMLQQHTGTLFRAFRMEASGTSAAINGPSADTNPHRIESGFTAGGTATLVVDSQSFNSALSGASSVNVGHVRLGAGGAGADQFCNVRIAEHMILRDEPSTALKAALREYATRYYAGAV